MSLAYGLKAINTKATTNKPHIFGFTTPRTGTDSLFEVWNDDTGTSILFKLKVTQGELGGDLSLTGPAAGTRRIVRSVNTGLLFLSGGTSDAAGANIALAGGAHATLPNVMTFREDSVERMRLEAGILRVGTTAAGNATAGGVKAVGVSEFGTIQLTVNQALNVVTSAGAGRAVLGDSSVAYIWFDVDNRGMRFGASSAANMGFFGTAPVAKPTGVAVSAAGIHAALVTLGLIAA